MLMIPILNVYIISSVLSPNTKVLIIQKIGNGEIERIELSENSNSAKIKIKNVEEEEKIQVPNRQAFIELIQDEIKERQLC